MSQILNERGFFWWLNHSGLPAGSQETSVPAQLTIDNDGQITLEVEGVLCGKDETRDWDQPRKLPESRRLVGRLAESYDYVLLESLERTDFWTSDEVPRQQRFSIGQCTRRNSPFPDDYIQQEFLELRIEMQGYEEWLKLDSILVSMEDREKDNVQVTVSYKEHEFASSVSDGTISIKSMTTGSDLFGFFEKHPRRETHFKQTNDLIFRFEKLSDLSNLRYIYTKLEELIALLTGFYRRLSWPILVRREEPFDSGNTFYFYRGSSSDELINENFFWIPFSGVRDCFGELFEGLRMKSETLGAAYYLYVASMRNPHAYSEDRFINLVWCIEALHRKTISQDQNNIHGTAEKERIERIINLLPHGSSDQKWLQRKLKYAYEPSLETRIVECFRELPVEFGKGQLEKFAKECADRRNDISHEGGPRGNMDYDSFINNVRGLTEVLDYLLHALLLHHIGVASDVLFKTITASWLAERHIKPALAQVGLQIQALKL